MTMFAIVSVKMRTARRRAKGAGLAAKRRTSAGATTASRVFPEAMPTAVKRLPAVVALTTKAPSSTAGQRSRPRTSRAAIAIPVGGQIGEALGFSKAKRRPSFPAATYTTVSKSKVASQRDEYRFILAARDPPGGNDMRGL